MTKLSVNINKVATLRNARGGDVPDVVRVAADCQRFGGEGITVHPRPDQRHITHKDVFDLLPVITTEYNIEGNPTDEFIDLATRAVPTQVTLVPDAPTNLTSNAGWDTQAHTAFLKEVTARFHRAGIRVSIFVDPLEAMVDGAREAGADRVELYTERFARLYAQGHPEAVEPYVQAAQYARSLGLGVNAGHDLSLDNIEYFIHRIPFTDEVSIGHALISEALYLGLENTIGAYRNKIRRAVEGAR